MKTINVSYLVNKLHIFANSHGFHEVQSHVIISTYQIK